MNNKEINRYIHVEIMGNCDHEWDGPEFALKFCVKCPMTEVDAVELPDYCSPASPRRLLNEVVAKFRVEEIGEALRTVLNIRRDGPRANAGCALRATAEQIARACVEAHKLTAKPAA